LDGRVIAELDVDVFLEVLLDFSIAQLDVVSG
jgi:hypothetical protein